MSSGSYGGFAEAFEEATVASSSFSFGARIPLGPAYLNFDAGLLGVDGDTLAAFDEGSDRFGGQYRAMVELPLFWGLSASAGVGSYYLVEGSEEMQPRDLEDGVWSDFWFVGAGVEL